MVYAAARKLFDNPETQRAATGVRHKDLFEALPQMSRAEVEAAFMRLVASNNINHSQLSDPKSLGRYGISKQDIMYPGGEPSHIFNFGHSNVPYQPEAGAVDQARVTALGAQRAQEIAKLSALEQEAAAAATALSAQTVAVKEGETATRTRLDRQIESSKARVVVAEEAETKAVERAAASREAAVVRQERAQARASTAASAASAQRRAAETALTEAQAGLGALTGQVGTSAAGQRGTVTAAAVEAERALLAAYLAEQEAVGNVAVATGRATAAKVAMTGATRAAGAAVSGLVGLLGGPFGAALTTAAVAYAGYELITARAAEQVEAHVKAVDKLIERTKALQDLNASGNLRSTRQQIDDTEAAKGTLRSARDQRDAIGKALDQALDKAGIGTSPGSRQVYNAGIGADVSLPMTTIDDAAARAGTSVEALREKIRTLPPGSIEAAKAARQLADAVLDAAKTDTRLGSLAQSIDDIAGRWEKAAAAARGYVDAQAAQPQRLATPLDDTLVRAPKFDAAPAIASTKAELKELQDQILSLGSTDIDKLTFGAKGIAATVQVVELLGRKFAGDGGAGLYARTAQTPAAGADAFTGRDGAVFLRVAIAADVAAGVMDAGFEPFVAGLPKDPPPGSGKRWADRGLTPTVTP